MHKKLLTLLTSVVFSLLFFIASSSRASAADCYTVVYDGSQPRCVATSTCSSGTSPTLAECEAKVTVGQNQNVNYLPELKAFTDANNLHALGEAGTSIQVLGLNIVETLESVIICSGVDCNMVRADGSPKGSFTSAMTTMMAQMYANPPATTGEYVGDALASARIIPQAQAQGLGFASLTPILSTWKIFRNIAYFFFIIIFLAIGFLIMFRSKIGGQTAVTAQQAIPRVIVALLAVTFSYAIAGLLIDIMYLVMFLLAGIFGSNGNHINSSIFSVGIDLVTKAGVAGDSYDAVSEFVKQLLAPQLGGGVAWIASIVSGLTAAVVVVLALAISIFRLFFELLKTYVSIVISIALAPLVLMWGAIPGKNTFSTWVKSLIGNLSAFPIVLLILIIHDKLTSGLSNSISGGFLPPYLIGNGQGQALSVMIGLGFLMLSVELVKEGKKAMGASGGFFDQFAGNLADNLKRGFTGGELIPGLGITDTSKWLKQYGGVSGKNVAQKALLGLGMGGTGLAAGASSLARLPFNAGLRVAGSQLTRRGYGRAGGALTGAATTLGGSNPIAATVVGGRAGGQFVADQTEDRFFKKNREARRNRTKTYGST